MKKTFLFLLGISAALMASAEVRVLSDVKLGEGYFPRFADAETVTYLAAENAQYVAAPVDQNAEVRVDNENLDLNLYRNGKKVVLKPHGDANYIWVSLSPNQKMILFNTQYGTAICDLNGKEIVNLGRDINAPVWYGNDYVVGMDDEHDGYYNTASSIVMASVDGKTYQRLTEPAAMGIFPNVDVASGRIVYNTDGGDIRLLQLNMTEQPIRKATPRLVQKPDGTLLKKIQDRKEAKDPSQVKIYINPGHGGYDSDDRLMYLYPIFVNQNVSPDCIPYQEKYKEVYEANKAAGLSDYNAKKAAEAEASSYARQFSFWESQSNLDKGMRLDTMLRDLGFKTKMSRITNTTADDKSLYGIVEEANNWGASFMLSIHSNAGNPSNYVLQLYSGRTEGDNSSYSHMPANEVTSRKIATLMGDNQYSNEVSCWTRVPMIAGDKTFAKNIMGWSNGYGVLRWLNVPGTLSEGMMHDYLPETYRLMNMDYKRQESFYFAKTFYTWFCEKELPYGAIGGRIHDVYQKQLFPDYKPNKNTRDVLRPINRGVVELWQNDTKLASYTTDTLYNGCYFFWNLKPGTYVVKATPDGYYAQEETLVVENNKISYANFSLQMKRQTPPEVLNYTPKVEITDSVLVSTHVTISFNWDMDEEETAKAFSISPAVEGTITFEDDAHTLRFKPASRFEPGVLYTVTLSTGACHPDKTYENHLQEPVTFKFCTQNRGSVRLIQTYPANGSEGNPVDAAFIAIFDAKLANVSNKHFQVFDADGNDISPASRNVKLNGAAPLPYGSAKFELKAGTLKANSEYKMVIGAKVADIDNVLINDPITITFKTGDEVTSALPIFNNLDTLYFEGDKETSLGVTSVLTARNTASKYEGYASNKLTYTFSETNGEAVYAVDDVTAIKGNDKSTLGMHVFGDYTFNTLYAKWAVDGDIQYTKICDLDYAGWLYQEANTAALPAGVDYQFMGFKIVRGTSFLSEKGEVSIDALRVQFEESSTTDVENLTVEQNTNSKFIENGYLHILFNGVQYNAEGKVMK